MSIFKPRHFDRASARFKDTGKLSPEDFDSPKEIGMFIDFCNQGVEEQNNKTYSQAVDEISKYLLKIQNTKTFLL